ncbi:uncharacterized protein LOC113142634 isoform X2 [Xyrichtys novacula]|uniref:Uncharacterized protein LOC113142634 isoform X2 n=1 Tax=Xyrichtys novacula TaxID=13765 RepID=A0AAV1FRM4_XYRNO|nr:uncharacterized protein LOC113142634 isoform X2 [Xyrichtys novacula]
MPDVVGLLKEEAYAFCCKPKKNEDGWTTDGMLGNSPAVLAVASVVSLSLISLLCLRCKKKSKTIHEVQQVYNTQIFENRNFGDSLHEEEADEQSDYQNITEAHTGTSADHTYVAPLPIAVYENENGAGVSQPQDVYVNITQERKSDDEDDYENSEFLKEQEEPDYVNENGEDT